MKARKRTVMTTVIAILLILIAVAGSYAYFMVNVDNTNDVSVNVTAKNLSIEYSDGAQIDVSNILPGASFRKTLTVTNNGTTDITFDLELIDVVNELTNKDYFTYDVWETTATPVLGITEFNGREFPSANATVLTGATLAPGETGTIAVLIHFLNTSSDQNVDMDKTIAGTLNITNVVES